MNDLRIAKAIIVMLFMCLSATSCGGDVLMSEEGARQEWSDYKDFIKIRAIEAYVGDEVAGKEPPGGIETWDLFWRNRIEHLSNDLEENDVYIEYVMKLRERAGLSPLRSGSD